MLKNREYRMDNYIDRLELEGSVAIPWAELYQIYNCERLNKNVYRDIFRRWEELCTLQLGQKTPPKLTVMTTYATFTLFREAFSAYDDEKQTPLEDWI